MEGSPPVTQGEQAPDPNVAIMSSLDAIQRQLATIVETQEWQSEQIEQLCTVTNSLQEQVETVQERCFDLSQRFEQHVANCLGERANAEFVGESFAEQISQDFERESFPR